MEKYSWQRTAGSRQVRIGRVTNSKFEIRNSLALCHWHEDCNGSIMVSRFLTLRA